MTGRENAKNKGKEKKEARFNNVKNLFNVTNKILLLLFHVLSKSIRVLLFFDLPSRVYAFCFQDIICRIERTFERLFTRIILL